MKKRKQMNNRLQFTRLHFIIIIFLAVALVLVVMQRNVVYKSGSRILELLPVESDKERAEREAVQAAVMEDVECLLIWEDDEIGVQGRDEMEAILDQIKVPYKTVRSDSFELEELDECGKVVLSMTHIGTLGEKLLDLMNWVEEGGSLLLLYPPETTGTFTLIKGKLGITTSGDTMTLVEGIKFDENFMIGGAEREFGITDPYESSLSVTLGDDCRIYAESAGENPTPIIWKRKLGDGTVVVDNLGFMGKVYRGIYCAAYSLMDDVFAWPVINGSTFYIDDFPSPVPGGDSTRLKKDFGMSIKEFYTQKWWPDIYNLAEKYGIRYTGMVIEQYSDQVEAPFERNGDIRRYQYFGNMLLRQGGEIGFHGYNHMPLVLENFDYMGLYDSYQQWKSHDDMKAGIQELNDFCTELFPKEDFQVYVPPSNILSEEGRAMLQEEFPNIRAIASTYIPGGLIYEQEFEESDDGIIETPRTISGYILDDYDRLTAFAELNFHFVNSHFEHPDDVLDEDRGADLGWNEMYRRISDYAEWLYTSAPDIRNLTGSELAAAVQRYDRVVIRRIQTQDSYLMELDGFTDEAWMLVRINEGDPGEVSGGTLTKLTDSLYLLKAEKDRVEISID